MERKVDAIEAYQQGWAEGVDAVLKLINKYCGFDAKDVPRLITLINQQKENHALDL